MVKYRVTFIYGPYHLWADVERPHISNTDRRGFADMAEIAVHAALDAMIGIERKYRAHDYLIFEITETVGEVSNATIVYAFDTLEYE